MLLLRAPGEQHTNLWYTCGFLGSLLYLMSTVSIFVWHDDFEQAYAQLWHHNLDAHVRVFASGLKFRGEAESPVFCGGMTS